MSEIHLDVAHRIGMQLCRDAVRSNGRCNWLGDSMELVVDQWRVAHRSFGGDLYSGTSGVALFLAQLDRFRPDPLLRDTARAALEHALTRDDGGGEAGPQSFYSGTLGSGFAAAEIGGWWDDGSLVERGLAIVKHATAEIVEPTYDILGGSAGWVGPLLRLHRQTNERWLLDTALRAGEHLVRTAKRGERGASWGDIPKAMAAYDLTGYSHGAAGVAVALLELHAETHEQKYLDLAKEAFAYERSWFSPQQQNWPDFRSRVSAEGQPEEFACGLSWCHGAPGIGLSRLRAWQLTGDDAYRDEAQIALRATHAPLSMPSGELSFSLCHGIAGNADLFLEAADLLGDAQWLGVAESIGVRGVEYYHHARRRWPCGIQGGGETPGLLLGLAGIGWFFLRLHDRKEVPSVLLVH
jgi:lantibiotic modifying enzyme